MSNKTITIIIVSMIGTTFLGMGVWLSSQSTSKKSNVVEVEKQKEPTVVAAAEIIKKPKKSERQEHKSTIPAYRIISDTVERDDQRDSYVQVEVFMEDRVTNASLRRVINHLHKRAKQTGPFKYRLHPNIIDIRVFARKGQSWIARGWGTDTQKFSINISENLIASIYDEPIVKFGLTESERQKIWRDVIRTEDRAGEEAEAVYPYYIRNSDPD